jgi:lipopolysaccharide export LptBFGC system permease protein LptF
MGNTLMRHDLDGSAHPPGDWCRPLLGHFFAPATMVRIVDPILADCRKEFSDAGTPPRRWERLVLSIRWSWALVRALLLYALLGRADSIERDVWRGMLSGLTLGGGLVLLLSLGTMVGYVLRAAERVGRPWLAVELLADLLPSALAAAVPCGVLLGALAGRSGSFVADVFGRVRPLVLASVLGSMLAFGLVAWVVPDANQAFRVAVWNTFPEAERAMTPKAPPRGEREMTLTELRTLAQRYKFSKSPVHAAQYQVEWHRRFAIPGACLVFGLTGAVFGRFRLARSTAGRLALSVAVVSAYYALLSWGSVQSTRWDLAPALGVWLANAAFTAIAASVVAQRLTQAHQGGR